MDQERNNQFVVEIPGARIEIRPDGILHVHVTVDTEMTMEHAKAIVAARTELAQGRKYPLLSTASKYTLPNKEVRDYIASERRSELVLADAIVFNGLGQRLMANIFLKINKPVRPIRVFTEKEEAVDWLLSLGMAQKRSGT
jgi:hypothetical protein